jgi:polysaccharide export outer membrane protein
MFAPPRDRHFALMGFVLLLALGALPLLGWSQAEPISDPEPVLAPPDLQTTADWNERLQELADSAQPVAGIPSAEYRIGPEDLVEITVFEAPEFNRSLRVSASGEVTLPVLGAVKAAGLTPQELEFVLQELLRRTIMKDPHVGVYVREMQSHPVSVFGAVRKPGIFQIRGTRTLLEVLSMAEGLEEDAGDTVVVMRGAGSHGLALQGSGGPGSEETAAEATQETFEVSLKRLLESGDPRYNPPIYPGDIVKVTRAGIVYVIGDVNKPGGFALESNENISVLQALARAEGVAATAAKSKARIIRTDEITGARTEIPLDVGKILRGEAPDPYLQANDIVFIPDSKGKKALYTGLETTLRTLAGIIIWR